MVIDLNSHRPGWAYDPVCGIWYEANGVTKQEPEFMIITKKPGASGLPQLCATFPRKALARRWQLEHGRVEDTRILEI